MRSGDTCSTFPSVPFLTPSPRSFFRNMMRSPVAKSRAPRSADTRTRSEEHTSELQSLMRISYAVFCLKKKKKDQKKHTQQHPQILITKTKQQQQLQT